MLLADIRIVAYVVCVQAVLSSKLLEVLDSISSDQLSAADVTNDAPADSDVDHLLGCDVSPHFGVASSSRSWQDEDFWTSSVASDGTTATAEAAEPDKADQPETLHLTAELDVS